MSEVKPTTIYILWPGSSPDDCIVETHQLGTFQCPKKELGDGLFTRDYIFYKSAGYVILEELIRKDRMDIIKETKIFSSNGKPWTLEKFLNSLDSVKMK